MEDAPSESAPESAPLSPLPPFDPQQPLHGVTLKAILEHLVATQGWARMAERVNIRCFSHEPSVNSSLKFLRRTPWARAKVEAWFIAERRKAARRTPGPRDG